MNFPSWHSYPSIYNLGHRYIENLLTLPVIVEEKVDGSQFSFGLDDQGELHIRSKGAKMHLDAPEKMFQRAADTVKELKPVLTAGWTYRCEYLAKPKHNSLSYSRIPDKHLVIFDINTAEASYLPYASKQAEANRIGLECVPLLFDGHLDSIEAFQQFLDHESFLGGQRIEGVVVKPRDYNLFGVDKKVLMGKFVSEHFREVHAKEWKGSNVTQGDILIKLGEMYSTPARWDKAVIHLREKGLIEDSPRDIGPLLKEIAADILADSQDDIKQKLFEWAWDSIRRRSTYGFPEWYKEQLLKRHFEGQ